jgi:hypothetical protein
VPEGWRQESGSDLRYATFRLGPKDSSLELTVIPLGREAGSILANVNRWRQQIGLKPVSEAELSQVSKQLKIDGISVTWVDMTGSSSGASGRSPPFAGRAGGLASRPSLKYSLPDGWKKSSKLAAMSVATLQVTEGGQAAEVTITPLSGRAGGLIENVKRWRGQINLGPAGDEQIRKEVREINVAGGPAQYVDLIGPETDGPRRQRLLGVVAERGEQTWFIKMKGPADLVAKQKAAFEAFVGSVRFDGSRGANDE